MRFKKQLMLTGFGKEKQEKLKNKSVAVVGLGGLGSAVSLYLSSSGIKNLILIDFDELEESNLPRQVLYTENDLGKKKAIIAKILKKRNKNLEITVFPRKFNEFMLKNADIVVDCTDNLAAKKQLNKLCIKIRKPLVFGSAAETTGMVTTIVPGKTPCLNCFIQKNESKEKGVLSILPGIIGTIQATEAIKYLTNFGENLLGKLLHIDVLKNEYNIIKIKKNKKCRVCSNHP